MRGSDLSKRLTSPIDWPPSESVPIHPSIHHGTCTHCTEMSGCLSVCLQDVCISLSHPHLTRRQTDSSMYVSMYARFLPACAHTPLTKPQLSLSQRKRRTRPPHQDVSETNHQHCTGKNEDGSKERNTATEMTKKHSDIADKRRDMWHPSIHPSIHPSVRPTD